MIYYGISHWTPTDVIYHHGILGQKWGIRRYQNEDGSLKAAGKKRYGDGPVGSNKKSYSKKETTKSSHYKMSDETKSKLKKAAIAAGVVAAAGLAVYGGYKLNSLATDTLKSGDLYAAAQKEVMAKMSLSNYLEQRAVAYDYHYNNKIRGLGNFDSRTHSRMLESASDASKRYLNYSKEANKLLDRANSGKYSIGDKARVLKKIMKNKRR